MGFFSRRRGARRYEAGEFLFCREILGIQMIDRILELFEEEAETSGNTLTFRRKGMEISFAAFGTGDEGEAGVYARRELDSIRDYFRQVRTENTDTLRNLMFVLGRCQGIVRVNYSFELRNERADQERIAAAENMIAQVLRGMSAVMTKGGEAIAGADGKVILDGNGESEVKSFLPPLEDTSQDDKKKGIPGEALERRRKSVMELRHRQIYVPFWLPVLETEARTQARTKRQVCGRAAALLTVALYSECLLGEGMKPQQARAFVREIIEHFRADEFFSPAEKAYLKDDFSEEAVRIHFSWQYENLYVMEWALGMFDSLSWPEKICDVGECVRKMREFDSFSEFEQAVKLRSKRELLDAADFIYRLDWACTDAGLNGFPAPGGILPDVVMERHRALFWAAGCMTADPGEGRKGQADRSAGWDRVDLST